MCAQDSRKPSGSGCMQFVGKQACIKKADTGIISVFMTQFRTENRFPLFLKLL